jgi:hypothetical protein
MYFIKFNKIDNIKLLLIKLLKIYFIKFNKIENIKLLLIKF